MSDDMAKKVSINEEVVSSFIKQGYEEWEARKIVAIIANDLIKHLNINYQ